jgi:hypothetical protein
MGGEVSLHLLGLSNHGILPLLSVCGAGLTFVSGDELKSLKNPLGPVYRAADGELVYRAVPPPSERVSESPIVLPGNFPHQI